MLHRLLKGRQISISIGKPPNAELLFSAPAKLLMKFSTKWHHELTDNNVRILYVSAHKEAVKFVIEWMAAGGTDNARGSVSYPKDDLLKILCLNKLAVHLEISALVNRTLREIKVLSQHGSMTSDQIARAFVIAQPMSQARFILEQNLTKWMATFGAKEWETKCELALNKAAVEVLTNLWNTAMKSWRNQNTQTRAIKNISAVQNRQKRGKKAMKSTNKAAIEEFKPNQNFHRGNVASGSKTKREAMQPPKRPNEKIKQIPKGHSLIKALREGKIEISTATKRQLASTTDHLTGT